MLPRLRLYYRHYFEKQILSGHTQKPSPKKKTTIYDFTCSGRLGDPKGIKVFY
jgi:hypothetical protein